MTGLAALAAVVLSASSAMAAPVSITSADEVYAYTWGTARVEIAGNYGAPQGFGRSALEVDTVNATDDGAHNEAAAGLWSRFRIAGQPEAWLLGDLTELSVWAYRDGNSVHKTLPTFKLIMDIGAGAYLELELRAQDNPQLAIGDDTWTKLDLAGDTQWTMEQRGSVFFDSLFPDASKQTATLQEIAERFPWGSASLRVDLLYLSQGDVYGGAQAPGSLYTAFDGATLSTATGSSTFDFEAGAASKDECKNGGWAIGSTWKNQGECIASFVTAP
ncbi:hypothetical protein [Knoellia koreensis]|uniref:Uncharacterized protein n=1 Tax=Knoellia koreensis TaxID=2730921 RepID=A0A849HPE1_9MICO|nr:hypothetical protein [Knoellia sp. DB2414S]NNM48281.1 hypothetical protein [Knoellia sp. DB2414S]